MEKIYLTGDYIAGDGNDYFEFIIDKLTRTIFVAKNFSCTAATKEALSKYFKMEYTDLNIRFSIVFSGTEININRIPKKYSKFKLI